MEQDKNTAARIDPAVLAGIHRQLDDYLSGGDAKLILNLGYAFEKGETVREPVRQNYLAAAACYEAAARLGDAPALNDLGWLYENGFGVPQDYEKARRFYTYGAKNGDAFCWTQLGGMYAKGLGVPVDFRKAKRCYLKAVNAGDGLGFYNLGWLYEHGDLGDPDLKTAAALYKLGAFLKDKHSIRALVRLGYATVTP